MSINIVGAAYISVSAQIYYDTVQHVSKTCLVHYLIHIWCIILYTCSTLIIKFLRFKKRTR